MLEINEQSIYLTRGDSADLKFPAVQTNEDGTEEPYEFQEGDEVYFRLAQVAGQQVLIEKQCEIDSETNDVVLYLENDDTKDLKFGTYRYEVELISGTEHYTYIANQPFEIGKEVELRE